MNVSTFVNHVADILQEDFTYAPQWTKASLLSITRQALREFSERTLLDDKNIIRMVNATTGESDMPEDFISAYYLMFSQSMTDIVQLGELDFVSGSWLVGTTGIPRAATEIGSGDDTVVRFVPVPTSVSAATAGVSAYEEIQDSGGDRWEITFLAGVVLTTEVAGTTTSVPSSITVWGDSSTYWELTIGTDGVLTTTTTGVASKDTHIVEDSTSGELWELYTDSNGVLDPTWRMGGLAVRFDIDGTDQDFSSEYGVIVDAYVGTPSTSTDTTIYVNRPTGVSLFARTSEEAAYVWYKGQVEDVLTLHSELWINDCMVPVLLHGVLGMAYAQEGDGQDLDKSELLRQVFVSECESLKRIFQRRR
uniref:Uncharacterized protein n=1 Tax=viral metagenome TaxID=1070528 RepID=A0A6M3IGK1_9ZZZZ